MHLLERSVTSTLARLRTGKNHSISTSYASCPCGTVLQMRMRIETIRQLINSMFNSMLVVGFQQTRMRIETMRQRHSGKMTAHAQGRLRDFRARGNGRHNISIETNRVKMAAI